MREISPRNAGIFSAALALVLILCIYLLLGTVDVIFLNNGKQVYRIDDVSVCSPITVPETDDVYVYNTDSGEKVFADNFDFRLEICKTVLINLVTFKWQELDNVIELNKQLPASE